MIVYTITGRHPDGTVDVDLGGGFKFYGIFKETEPYYEGRLIAPDGTAIYDGVLEKSYAFYIEEYKKAITENE